MTTFDKRQEGFEKKFALDEEQKFKAEARRNKLLGLWAAEQLGKSGDEAAAYAKERVAFGQPIGSFQANKFTLADLDAQVAMAQTFVDACLLARSQGALDPIDASRAKLVATEVQGRVADAAVQLHGGYGYMRETAVARAWLDARVTRIWAGSNEIMREVIGRSLGL